MTVKEAKDELYNNLKKEFPQIRGAGVGLENGEKYISIYLSKCDYVLENWIRIHKKLPTKYQGFKIKLITTGLFTI